MKLIRYAFVALFTLPNCAAPASRMNAALGGTIIATEYTQEGKALRLPEAGITEVDVNSTIQLQMERNSIRAELYGAAGVGQSEILRITDDLDEIGKLLELHEHVIAKLTALTRLANTSPDPIAGKDLQALGTLQSQAVKAVKKYVELRDGSADRLYEKPGYVGVEKYLNERKSEALAEHERLVARLSGVRWRVQASLASGAAAVPIHLDNYDTHQPGTPHLVDKLVPVFANEQKEQYAKAKELTAVVAKLGKSTDAWTAEVAQLAKQTGGGMASLVASIQRELPMLADDLRRARQSTPEGSDLVRAIEAGFAEKQSLIETCVNVVERMRGLSSSKDTLFVMIGRYGGAAECKAKLKANGSRQYLSAIRDSAERLASQPAIESALLARVKTAAELEGKLAKLLDNCDWLEKPAQYTDLLQHAEPTDVPQFTDRAHDGIVDTTIDLVRTPRAEGDLVTYRPAVVIDGEMSRAGAPVHLRVVRNGMRVNVSPGAFFLRPHDFLRGKESEFSPAPAVTAAAHYRFGRADGEAVPTGFSRFWNLVDPGLGLHMATPVLGKRSEEDGERTISDAALGFGVGGTLQLFGDVAQAGIGYDAQSGRSYAFFGLGLHTLTNLGATFPANTGAAER